MYHIIQPTWYWQQLLRDQIMRSYPRIVRPAYEYMLLYQRDTKLETWIDATDLDICPTMIFVRKY